MSTYILWDIDGTLIQNTPSAGSLYIDAIEHVTGVRPERQVEDSSGMTEGQLLTELLAINGLDTARLGEVLYDLDVLSRDQFERGWDRDQCVGVEDALAAVSARGWTNALLTGNGPNRARYKLLAAGLDPELFDWDHSYFGHESPTRHHLTAGARAALAGNTPVIVGDTPIDGLAANSAGFPFIAVATGMYSADELAATNAVTVIEDLESGLDELLAAVEAAGAGSSDAAAESQDAEPAPAPESESESETQPETETETETADAAADRESEDAVSS